MKTSCDSHRKGPALADRRSASSVLLTFSAAAEDAFEVVDVREGDISQGPRRISDQISSTRFRSGA